MLSVGRAVGSAGSLRRGLLAAPGLAVQPSKQDVPTCARCPGRSPKKSPCRERTSSDQGKLDGSMGIRPEHE